MYFNDCNISIDEARVYNPQTLAFVGDAVHTLFVRGKISTLHHLKPNELHKASTEYIKASGQSEMVEILLTLLTEDEKDIFRRARNYKTNNIAKNASVGDYKRATGFEAVIGYLYLTGQHDRINEILTKVTNLGDNL